MCCISAHAGPDPAAIKIRAVVLAEPKQLQSCRELMLVARVLCSPAPVPTRAHPDQQREEEPPALAGELPGKSRG